MNFRRGDEQQTPPSIRSIIQFARETMEPQVLGAAYFRLFYVQLALNIVNLEQLVTARFWGETTGAPRTFLDRIISENEEKSSDEKSK